MSGVQRHCLPGRRTARGTGEEVSAFAWAEGRRGPDRGPALQVGFWHTAGSLSTARAPSAQPSRAARVGRGWQGPRFRGSTEPCAAAQGLTWASEATSYPSPPTSILREAPTRRSPEGPGEAWGGLQRVLLLTSGSALRLGSSQPVTVWDGPFCGCIRRSRGACRAPRSWLVCPRASPAQPQPPTPPSTSESLLLEAQAQASPAGQFPCSLFLHCQTLGDETSLVSSLHFPSSLQVPDGTGGPRPKHSS